jgi:hypothetical protein
VLVAISLALFIPGLNYPIGNCNSPTGNCDYYIDIYGELKVIRCLPNEFNPSCTICNTTTSELCQVENICFFPRCSARYENNPYLLGFGVLLLVVAALLVFYALITTAFK